MNLFMSSAHPSFDLGLLTLSKLSFLTLVGHLSAIFFPVHMRNISGLYNLVIILLDALLFFQHGISPALLIFHGVQENSQSSDTIW
jgi:hypothetical protein